MSSSDARDKLGLFSHWQQDFLSSLVVFLVALPLCMGVALASGAPVATGLVTGIVGGLVVGFLAGSPLQVSGPAAGLTVVCAEVIHQFGLPAMGMIVLTAGLLQIVAGVFRLGQWFRAVSPAVVHGMLSGIGVLILASQFHVLIDSRPHGHGLANLAAIPESFMKGLPLPAWEPQPVRESRADLVKAVGRLHERQDEIERSVARIVTEHGTDAVHEQEASQLPAFAAAQEQLLHDLRALREQHHDSPLWNVERFAEVRPALDKAEQQLEVALADLREQRLAAKQSQHEASESLAGILSTLKSHAWAGKVGLLAIAVVAAWNALARGRLKLVPAPLLAVVAATVLALSLSLPVLYVEVPDRLDHGLTFPSWLVFEDVSFRQIFGAGLMMAVIASAETLLCASAVDRMHQGPRTQYDRELWAQGVGNTICGLLGALPMTGVIVRSAANVQAGARSRLSSILHGAWLLLFVLLLGAVLRMIPVAALAGILVYTGFKLIDFKGFMRLWRESRTEALIFLVTLVVIVVEDLLMGVVAGIVLSAIKLFLQFSYFQFSNLTINVVHESPRAGVGRMKLLVSGAATFLRLPVLAKTLESVPKGTELHVDFEHLDFIDHACLELLMNWAKQHEASGGQLIIDWGELHARFRAPRHKKKKQPPAPTPV
jgi:MFS superfamily sulfate permease-like transporter